MATKEEIRVQLGNELGEAYWPRWGKYYSRGKVRDMYCLPASRHNPGRRIIIATDRQSAHDHIVGVIPHRGQVLTQTALWWFNQTEDIMPNAVLAAPDEQVVVMEELEMFPVELVVRAYLTGSTSTSIWTHYAAGERVFCGHRLPDGMVKNEPLPMEPIITPSTKLGEHDRSISAQEVLDLKLVDPDTWEQLCQMALALFTRGQELSAKRNLILVDTKYEFGQTKNGLIMIADEIHTPDSSRYWILDSYPERFKQNLEPEALDKEPLRAWLKEQGITDQYVPKLTPEVIVQMAVRYIDLYQRVTGEEFALPPTNVPVLDRIKNAIAPYMPKTA